MIELRWLICERFRDSLRDNNEPFISTVPIIDLVHDKVRGMKLQYRTHTTVYENGGPSHIEANWADVPIVEEE